MSQRMKNWFMSLPTRERARVAETVGTNVAYLNQMMYTTPADLMPHFQAKIAIGLDKASGGELDVRDMMQDGNEIDWEYVRKKLAAEKRGSSR